MDIWDYLSGRFWTTIDKAGKVFHVKAVEITIPSITEHLRNNICQFQSGYTEYQLATSHLHRNFKNAFKKDPNNAEDEFRQLQKFVGAGLKEHCGHQAESIQGYFNLAHKTYDKVRVGIHAVTDNDDVLDIILLPLGKPGKPKKIKNYTAFEEVSITGAPYKNNNIPHSALKDTNYKHDGINLAEVRNSYKLKAKDWKFPSRWRINVRKYEAKDLEWAAMSKAENAISLYKSHLVIPITFRDHLAKNRLNEPLKSLVQLKENSQSILGFIIVDHPATYYFDDKPPKTFDNIDVNVLYIYADIISLLLMIELNYVDGSDTCRDYLNNRSGKS